MAWVNHTYGHLRMGKRLLISSCDFLALSVNTVPLYWRTALQQWGALRGLVPWAGEQKPPRKSEVTYHQARNGVAREMRVDGQWSLGRVLAEPLFYNPHLSGWWGAPVLDTPEFELQHRVRTPKVMFARQSVQRVQDAREVYMRSKKFAAVGLTHICHLLDSQGNIMTWQGLKLHVGRRGEMPCEEPEFEQLLASIPQRWQDIIRTARLWINERRGRRYTTPGATQYRVNARQRGHDREDEEHEATISGTSRSSEWWQYGKTIGARLWSAAQSTGCAALHFFGGGHGTVDALSHERSTGPGNCPP